MLKKYIYVSLTFLLFGVFCDDSADNNPTSGTSNDPCAGVTCLNGGTCIDGSCLCPNGYTGDDCGTVVATDPCANVNCLNGGYCNNGVCVCPSGYAGADCGTTVDPCANITCQNGGSCVNGQCSCPEGYSGAACENVVTPSRVTISKIVVTDFPAAKESGSGWDLWDGPDLYIEIKRGTTTLYTSDEKSNANSSSYYTFTSGLPLNLNYPTSRHSIGLWDDDNFDAPDYLGGFYFTPFDADDDFPTTINMSLSTVGVKFTLYLSYTF